MTGNIVAALFEHDKSRALDPHLHTHCIIFNTTHDDHEDRWKALQNYQMLATRKYVETIYYHELARALHSFGYTTENSPRGDFRVVELRRSWTSAFQNGIGRLTSRHRRSSANIQIG